MTSSKWKKFPKILLNHIIEDAKKNTSYLDDNARWGVYFRSCELLFKGGEYFNQGSYMTSQIQCLGELLNTRVSIGSYECEMCSCRCHRFYKHYDKYPEGQGTCKCNLKLPECFDGDIYIYNIRIGIPPISIWTISLVLKHFRLPRDLRNLIIKIVIKNNREM